MRSLLLPINKHFLSDRWLSDFENFFDTNLAIDRKTESRSWSNFKPDVDVREDEKSYTFHFDLPGVDEKNISIELQRNNLQIRGKREQEVKESKNGEFSYSERTFGEFFRSFTLPEDVSSDEVTASYKDGVLEVIVPKSKKAEKKLISVKKA